MDAPNSTPNEEHSSFYAKHKKVYPREVHGLFASFRVTGVFVLLGLYYVLPWIQWEGHQAILFDLPERKFYIFGLTFWPQDFFYLAVILIIAALSLFFFTALAGRIWCGYACPQTVWTEVFLWIERKVEGSRNRQIKLDKSAMNMEKFTRKFTKHFIWIVFSAWTGFTFVGYFTPILELGERLMVFSLGPWETFWVIFYSAATYGNAGWMREQVCIYMCPYARFQSAMFDKDTLIISYDEARGEPRGARSKKVDRKDAGLGDCVDCTLCVQVCPTGIDIREGLQYQCISCAACVDVCNDVMDKMGYPRDLIKYTTENALEGKNTHVLRPRVFIYGGLLLLITAALVYSMVTRLPLELDIIRDRNALYRQTDMGLVENIYTLKIANMDDETHQYELSVRGLPDMELIRREKTIEVKSGDVHSVPVSIQVDPVHLKEVSNEIFFTLQARDEPELRVEEEAAFIGPFKQ